MRFALCAFAVLFFLSSQLAATSFGSSNTVQANVMVVCPIYLSTNALPVYFMGNSITMNYTISTQAVCSISDLQGLFTLEYSGNNVQVLSSTLPVTAATQNAVLYQLTPINSLALHPGDYKTVFDFSTFGTSNESVRTFTLISPVNIIMEDFAVSPDSVSVGSPLTFTANIMNDGELASGAIGVDIVVTGAQSTTISESASALSPGQSEVLTSVISNVTGVAGSYMVNAYATFASGNVVMQSNTRSAAYSVTAPVTAPVPAPSVTQPVVSVEQLVLSGVPSYSSIESGASVLSGMTFENVLAVPETVALTIPQEFDKMFSLATHSLYLMPNQSLQIQMSFNSNSTNQTGVYVIPVNVSVAALNGTPVSRTQYLTYVVEKSDYGVGLYNQISLSQASATVTTTLVGAKNSSLTNATLITTLPGAVVKDASQVKTYGLPATVTTVNGTNMTMAGGKLHAGRLATFQPAGKSTGPSYTIIRWLVPYLPQGKTITMAYTITNPTNVGLLTSVQNLLVAQSRVAPTGVLRVVNIQTPTFYTNSTNRITVGVLYTGTLQQNVSFIMTTTGNATILNPVLIVNASPNQLLQETFNVRTGHETGTVLFDLGIEAPNASLNYTLPVIVLPKTGPVTTTMPQQTTITGAQATKYVLIVLAVAAAGLLAGWLRGIGKRPRYNAERAKGLINIREQIKRSDEHA